MEISHDVDVPFPAAALNSRTLADVRLRVVYIPVVYRTEAVTVPVALSK
jgi:hypothetical protein